MKVLIVDDSENMRLVLRRYFEGLACEVREAVDIDSALALISQTDPPRLITLDLCFGEGGETRTLERLNEIREKAPDAVVIVLTGVVSLEDEAKVIAAGADGFIHKLECPTRLTFFDKLGQILRSLCATPQRYSRNISLVEGMATKFTDWVKEQTKA